MAFVTNQNWRRHFSVHTVRRLTMRNPCALSKFIRRRNSMQLELQRRRQIVIVIRQVLSKFFNNVKSTFDKTDGNATTQLYVCHRSHLMSVWIVDTEASDHLCSTCKFFLIYEPISRSLKTVNEPAQIIEKSMVSLCLVHSDSGIQEVILKDIMHASDSSANLVLTAACAWYLFWHALHLTSQNNVIECFWGQQDFSATPQQYTSVSCLCS
jgi:hypothetical protein